MKVVKKRNISASKSEWPCHGKATALTPGIVLTPMEKMIVSGCPDTIEKGMPYIAYDIKDGKRLTTIRCNPSLSKLMERVLSLK